MTRQRRVTLVTFVAALVLPLALFGALQAAFWLRSLHGQIEADALARARQVNADIDGRLLADQSALEVLALSHFLADRDFAGAKARVVQIQALRPAWRNVVLTDVAGRRTVWQTAPGDGAALRPWVADHLARRSTGPEISGVVGQRPDCPCIVVHAPILDGGRLAYLLSVELDPRPYQQILMSHAPPGATAAVVDRGGAFIARTLDYEDRLGKPATRFVRDALRTAPSGVYRGVTYEGQENYTAYATSALSGWSTHVAVRAFSLTGPRMGAILLTLLAALAAIGVALLLAAVGYGQVRARRLEAAHSAQVQKLAAVGQLASGIAHDFNNLLMVIASNLDRAAKVDDPRLQRPIGDALAATDRGVALIRQLMAFTRSQPLEICAVDLAALLANIRGLLEQSAGAAVSLQIAPVADGLRWVIGNVGQLEMALVNLAVNARDAMPSGGRLTIACGPSRRRPGYVDLEVTDTGEGMSPEVLERAMEPFFTTKPLGEGTGLGLAQVFGSITQSGGEVDIRSEPGRGTTATLTLRLAPATPPASAADGSQPG